MRNERRKQIMTLSILVVAVLVISVGFAAYSSTLRIDTDATVNPNANTFSVKFSTTQDTLTVADVVPTNYTTGITVTNGKIDNSGNPTISNLTAEFKNPGDYVEYVFYARNEGEYNAYLNNINFLSQKTCEAGEGATASLVESACNSISATVTIGGIDYTATTPITNHILNKKTGEEIKVTLKYADNGARADGPFTVNFGDITMVYSTINDSSYTPPVQAAKACSIERQVAGTYTVGDVVTCGEEYFYVIENQDNDTTTGVDMLSAYNLTLSTTNPIQDTTNSFANRITFSFTYYWWDFENNVYTVDTNYLVEGRDYPYVYGDYEGNDIYPYVEAYKNVLKGIGVNVIEAKLLSYEQAIGLGCKAYDCSSAPSWLNSSSYWLGTSNNSQIFTLMGFDNYLGAAMSDESIAYDVVNNAEYPFGIRPVITIQTSDLG